MRRTVSRSRPRRLLGWSGATANPGGRPSARAHLRPAPTLLVLASLLLVATCQTTAPPARIARVPSPIQPPLPGRALTEAESSAVLHAVSAAERGDRVAARRFVSGLPSGHPVTELVVLECDHLAGVDVLESARAFAANQSDYAAAWELVAQLEAEEGYVVRALEARRAVARARPGDVAASAVAAAESALVEATLRDGETRLAASAPAEALAVAREGLSHVPGAVVLRELAVRAALAADAPRTAAELVASLPDDDDNSVLKARVAAALGQWGLAMELYQRVPHSHPGRCEEYLEARERWRLSNAPPYVGSALARERIRRRDLAVILVWEMPGLVGLQESPVVVFEDVVQLPEQRDIVTVARADVMSGDAVTRHFSPGRAVTAAELRGILGRLTAKLGRPAPKWCVDEAPPGCVRAPEVLDGRSVARLIRSLVVDTEDLCR